MKELTDIISCVLFMSMKNSINNIAVIMAALVGVVQNQHLQRQKH